MTIVWTEYLIYRARLRGFDLGQLEEVLRKSAERYFDVETGRTVVIGRHKGDLVMIACEVKGEEITPVTVHPITRQQVRFRLQLERFIHE